MNSGASREQVDIHDRPEPLAYTARQAAAALNISERLLWRMTNAGHVPHVRIGRALRYPVGVLEDWLREQAAAEGWLG